MYELSAVHSFRNVHFFIPESAVYKLSAVQSIQSFPLYYPRVCCVRAVCCPLFQKFPTLLSQSLLCTRNVSIHCADKQAVPEWTGRCRSHLFAIGPTADNKFGCEGRSVFACKSASMTFSVNPLSMKFPAHLLLLVRYHPIVTWWSILLPTHRNLMTHFVTIS